MKPPSIPGYFSIPLLLACLCASPATAAQDAAKQKELAEARADLERASRRIAELANDGSRTVSTTTTRMRIGKPVLGVLLAPDAEEGVRITGVTPDSGADKAGLMAGDRLLRIDGKPVKGADGDARLEFARTALGDLKTGQPMQVTFQRRGQVRNIDVTPEANRSSLQLERLQDGLAPIAGLENVLPLISSAVSPNVMLELRRLGGDCTGNDCTLPVLSEALRWRGLNLASVDPQLGRYFGTDSGVLVVSTIPDLSGLQAGDVILEVEGKRVATPQEALRAMTARKPGEHATLRIMRDKSQRDAQVTVPERPQKLELVPAAPRPPAPPTAKPPAAPAAPPKAALLSSETSSIVFVPAEPAPASPSNSQTE